MNFTPGVIWFLKTLNSLLRTITKEEMLLLNKPSLFQQTPLPIQVIEADTFTKRFMGLMFRRKPLKKEGLWIKPCNSIHM